MRLGLICGWLLMLVTHASAACVCRCVDGEMQPLCSSTIDLPPICAPTICGIVPPSIAPIAPLELPPLGTSECHQRQVMNPDTRRYEWQRVCE